jgi:hypothetical protein
MTSKFAFFSIAITAVLTILIAVVGALNYQHSLKAQNMTANNISENNTTK